MARLSQKAIVADVLANMPATAKRQLKAMTEKELPKCHFGLGLWIRNEYLLHLGGKERDGQSGKIVRAIWAKLNDATGGK